MRKITIIFLIYLIVTSCTSYKTTTFQSFSDSFSKYRTSKSISLETIINPDSNYIEFENLNSLIKLNQKRFLYFAKVWLETDSLCIQKQKELKTLIDKVKNNANRFYIIESLTTPTVYEQLNYPGYIQYKKNYIYPYGYEVEIDTTNKVRLEELKGMISKICISGNCMVQDKRTKTFVDSIHFDIVDFKDGHGSEKLVFKDKKPFYTVKVYTDVAWPDFDCMSVEESNSFWSEVKKNSEKPRKN